MEPRQVPPEARAILPVAQLSLGGIIRRLLEPDAATFGADPVATRDALLLAAFDRAAWEVEALFGHGGNRRYGQKDFKHVRLAHPLGPALKPEFRAPLDLGPLPRGGSAHTVNSSSDARNQATGASFRIIADAGDWDRSLGTNAPGQSGDPSSPHYRDLFAPWSRGEYFPVAYSRPQVEAVAEARIVLAPAP